MPKDRYIPIMTGNQVNRAFYGYLLILLGMLYTFLVTGIIGGYDAPLSRFLGLAPGDKALIFDIAMLIALPLGLIIYRYLSGHRRKRRILRQNFLAANAADRLVVTRYNPQVVYKVTGGDPASGKIEVVEIWNVDGPVAGAECYLSDISDFEELVPAARPDR